MKLIIIIFLVVVLIEVVVLFRDKQSVSSTVTLAQYAKEVLAKCDKEKYRPGCYDREIPKLMDYISMEDTLKVTSIVQDKDKTYTFCHVLGHNLSAKEVKKDPSKWKEVVTRCPSGVCSNGCIHGGFQERFRSESLTPQQLEEVKPDLLDLCEPRGSWRPTGLEQGSCYHAVGHLLMYMTNADLAKSTNLCSEIAKKPNGADYSQVCFDGVFMQIFQPLEPEDFALVAGKQPTKDDVDTFCNKYAGKIKGSCLSESWPLFSSELKKPERLVTFCSKSEPSEQNRCFSGLFYVLTVQFEFDIDKISNFCLGLPPTISGLCFANTASRMIETDYKNIDKSIFLCENSQTEDNKKECFDELIFYSSYNFHAGSEEFLKLCNALPQPWKTKCLNGLIH